MIAKYSPTFTLTNAISLAWRAKEGSQQLREQLAALYGYRHVYLFRAARHALHALLRGLGKGGIAVLPAYNCIAVPEAVEWAGWQPALVDIANGDVNMTCETLEANLPKDARAVILTHQFGLPAAVGPILNLCRQRNLFVIEDVAPAMGARYHGRMVGSLGDAAVVSFHLTKVVNAGRGGALMTNDDKLAEDVAILQNGESDAADSLADFAKVLAWWGATRPGCYGLLRRFRSVLQTEPLYEVVVPKVTPPRDGFRSCSGYVARLASRQLESLAANMAGRQALASVYAEELAGLDGIKMPGIPEGAEPAWVQFPIFVERKEACYRYLLRHGVDLNWTFRYSCGVSYGNRCVPNSERAARTLVGLPTYPRLPLSEAHRICDLLRQFRSYS